MLNWRIFLSTFLSIVSPFLYKRWRFSDTKNLTWANLSKLSTIAPELEAELLILPEFLNQPGCLLDVGANNGQYIYAALKKKSASEIIAIEPIPRLCKQLKRIFPSIALYNVALTDVDGPRWLKIPNIGGKKLMTRATLNVDFKEPGETGNELIQVEATTIDKLWEKIGDPRLLVIKIDTEGHEFSVLKGSLKTLAKHRPMLLVEIEQRHHAEPISLIFSFLENIAYSCYYLDTRVSLLKPIKENHSDLQKHGPKTPHYINNFFFLPNENPKFFETVQIINQHISTSHPK